MGVQSDLAGPQLWDAGFLSDVLDGVNGYFDDVEAGGWTGAGTLDQVNVSYYSDFDVVISPTTGRARNVPRPRGTPLVSPITTRAARARIGSQRRRLAGTAS
jgi:hypothetical protein